AAGNRGDESWRARAMFYRQLGEDRGESRTANVSERFVVAAAVSAAEGKAFGTNASTTFLIRVTCDNHEHADRHPANGKDCQPLQAARLHLSIQRNLRRTQRRLGLRTARCRIKAQSEELLVARHGARAR